MTLPKLMNPCGGCRFGSLPGYVPAHGSGDNGVLMIAEAAGADEALDGVPLVGKAGQYLFQQLQRVGIERDGFRLHNVLSCRPPDNKLAGESYEEEVIERCSPLLDETITDMRQRCQTNGKTFVILTLGKIAFKRILGLKEKDPILQKDYLNYPFWSERYGAWVIAAHHPSYLMRGNHHLVKTLQFAATRALEIATNGLTLDTPHYEEDPDPMIFHQWTEDYFRLLSEDSELLLSYDIETPMKQGEDEEEVAKEDDDDYTILRCSFTHTPGYAVSVPWTASYWPTLERIFTHCGQTLGWNSNLYDDPRITHHVPAYLGPSIDGMLAWHVLHSDQPKGLGFVTPYYVQNTQAWKYLSDVKPAFYNAKDSDMALRNYLGIREDLKREKLWHVFDRHVIKLNKVFNYMSSVGVMRDESARNFAESKVSTMLTTVKTEMEEVIPSELRPYQTYKRTPFDTTDMVQLDRPLQVTQCPGCGAQEVLAPHFKSVGKKLLKGGSPENPCLGLKPIKVLAMRPLWSRPLEFKVSNQSLQAYQKIRNHTPVFDPKEKKITFNEKAILRLMKKYPKDPLYPKVLVRRETQGHLSKYIGITQDDGSVKGGLPVDKYFIIHTTMTHNPSTLRSAAQNPPLQQLPRPTKNPEDISNLIRALIIPRPGHTLLARDFSGIEAVLVGYFAMFPEYIRLAKLDVHSFYTAYGMYMLEGRLKASDLPELSWPDERLIPHLKWLKTEFNSERNSLYKHLIHGANFMQGPQGAAEKILLETGVAHPVKKVGKLMDVYFDIFPQIKKWHTSTLNQADKDGFLRNPFSYVHRFNRVFSWELEYGKWVKSNGPDSNKAIAFLPQSTAAGIIKEVMLRLYYDRFSDAGQYLRLLVHDELFCEPTDDTLANLDLILQEEMERPIPELALPASYGMGPYLSILTEAKQGPRWSLMK